MTNIDYYEVSDSEAAAHAALEIVLEHAGAAIGSRGRFVLGLCGGRTPERLYQLLADTHQDWQRWHLVYGDERCLPEGHEDRNSTMVERCWLDKVGFPPGNHHVPEAGLEADIAASRYVREIEALLPLDLALLGMGEDGHTASLFPGHLHPDAPVVPVYDAPKPPPARISLSYVTLCDADTVCFVVTGESKRTALQRWAAGEDIPVARVHGRRRTALITDVPHNENAG